MSCQLYFPPHEMINSYRILLVIIFQRNEKKYFARKSVLEFYINFKSISDNTLYQYIKFCYRLKYSLNKS
jgi:hypothetical protein